MMMLLAYACFGGSPATNHPVNGADHNVLITASDFGLTNPSMGLDPTREHWTKVERGGTWSLTYRYQSEDPMRLLQSELQIHPSEEGAKGAMTGYRLGKMLGDLRFSLAPNDDLLSLPVDDHMCLNMLEDGKSAFGTVCAIREGNRTYLLAYIDETRTIEGAGAMNKALAGSLEKLEGYSPEG